MLRYLTTLLALVAAGAVAQEPVLTRAAVVALTDDAEPRQKFETRLVARARQNNYDAVTSFDIEPDVRSLDDRGFVDELRSHGIQSVLMLRPAALGEPVADEDEGIERLQELIEYNINAVRPAIRRHLGLPPLDED